MVMTDFTSSRRLHAFVEEQKIVQGLWLEARSPLLKNVASCAEVSFTAGAACCWYAGYFWRGEDNLGYCLLWVFHHASSLVMWSAPSQCRYLSNSSCCCGSATSWHSWNSSFKLQLVSLLLQMCSHCFRGGQKVWAYPASLPLRMHTLCACRSVSSSARRRWNGGQRMLQQCVLRQVATYLFRYSVSLHFNAATVGEFVSRCSSKVFLQLRVVQKYQRQRRLFALF